MKTKVELLEGLVMLVVADSGRQLLEEFVVRPLPHGMHCRASVIQDTHHSHGSLQASQTEK